MRVVIDSNILFSALIMDSATRKLILESEEPLLFPSYIFEEMERHKDELIKKSGMRETEFRELMELILEKVVVVPKEELIPHRDEAIELVKGIDEDDAVFVACVLGNPGSVLWTDDKDLRKVGRIRTISTGEMLRDKYTKDLD